MADEIKWCEIVDVVARVDNTFLSRHDMLKGTMILVDADRADALLRGAKGKRLTYETTALARRPAPPPF